MSGHPDCPMCRQRTVYGADGVTVILQDASCIGAAGCVLKDAMVADMLRNAEPYLRRMQAKAAAAREARIQAAREAVLEAVRAKRIAVERYHRDLTIEANDAHTDALAHYERCVSAMIAAEAEGGER